MAKKVLKRKPRPVARKAKKQDIVVAVQQQPIMLNMHQVILAAARDKDVDPNKFDKLVDIQIKVDREQDRRDFVAHMSALQSEITQIATDCANTQTGSKYASYAALNRALRPFYTAHGFSVSFDNEDCPRGSDWLRVVCIVARGAWESRHRADVLIDKKGPRGNDLMTGTHAGMSADSYGRRYSLMKAFNLVAFDDDGNAAGGGIAALTKSQQEEMTALAQKHGLDLVALCKEWEFPSLDQIPRSLFNRLKSFMYARAKRISEEQQQQKETTT